MTTLVAPLGVGLGDSDGDCSVGEGEGTAIGGLAGTDELSALVAGTEGVDL